MSNKNQLVEIFPYGITLSGEASRPIMIFKDENENRTLPVWLSPLDAGITIHQNSVELGYSSSPYSLTWKILKPLEIFLEKCVFTDVKGHHQYVTLHFKGHPKLDTMEARADEAVSFCLSNKTKFFCEADYFEKCRVVDAEMMSVGNKVKQHPQRFTNTHKYLN